MSNISEVPHFVLFAQSFQELIAIVYLRLKETNRTSSSKINAQSAKTERSKTKTGSSRERQKKNPTKQSQTIAEPNIDLELSLRRCL